MLVVFGFQFLMMKDEVSYEANSALEIHCSTEVILNGYLTTHSCLVESVAN